jgi:hypothetical protein
MSAQFYTHIFMSGMRVRTMISTLVLGDFGDSSQAPGNECGGVVTKGLVYDASIRDSVKTDITRSSTCSPKTRQNASHTLKKGYSPKKTTAHSSHSSNHADSQPKTRISHQRKLTSPSLLLIDHNPPQRLLPHPKPSTPPLFSKPNRRRLSKFVKLACFIRQAGK